jgi:hypothetical protein
VFKKNIFGELQGPPITARALIRMGYTLAAREAKCPPRVPPCDCPSCTDEDDRPHLPERSN